MGTAELDQALVAEELLANELENYAGKWVGIRDHAVVASADTLNGLMKAVDLETLDHFLEVAEEPTAGCFY